MVCGTIKPTIKPMEDADVIRGQPSRLVLVDALAREPTTKGRLLT